jgi:hypothetical protein
LILAENQSYLDKYGRFNASQAWQEGKAPIVRFVTDDEKVVGMMFAHITRTYEDQIVKALMVSGPAGVVVVRGPEVAAVGLIAKKRAQLDARLANRNEVVP